MNALRYITRARAILLCFVSLASGGCEGDGSDGASPRILFNSTRECLRFIGGFPSGFTSLPGSGREAAVVQFLPTAILGLDLDTEPPSLLASSPIPSFPALPGGSCVVEGVDSDSDGVADTRRSNQLGFGCSSPVAGSLLAIDPDRVVLSTSTYEQLVFFDPRDGTTQRVGLDTPMPSRDFDPMDWPFWPSPGAISIRSAFSTRACVYTQKSDSLGDALGSNRFCDATREGFVTRLTAGAAASGDRLFVTTSNLLNSSQARWAPGTVLVFDLDRSVTPNRLSPDTTRAVIFTSAFNPTSIEPYTTPAGRALLLVGVTGAIANGTGPGLVRSDSAIDVIDPQSRTLIATIPLGPAGLGDSGISIDPSGRIALIGAFTSRRLFGIDLAALDDPNLGLGPEPLPIVLDGSTPGFRDARLYDANAAFELSRRADGPSELQCSTITSVAISQAAPFAVASDWCDGTLSVLDIALPLDRSTPLDPLTVLSLNRVEVVAAPVIDTSRGLTRAIDRVMIRPGRAGIDFTGPDVYYTAGLEGGAVCGVRIRSF